MIALGVLILLHTDTASVPFPPCTMCYNQTVMGLHFTGETIVKPLSKVVDIGIRRETQNFSALTLEVGIAPEPAAGLVRDKLVEYLDKRLVLVRNALFFPLDYGGQVIRRHPAYILIADQTGQE